MSQEVPAFADLLADCRRSAVHLEMRDAYAVDYETGDFAQWRETGVWNNPEYWQPWKDIVSEAVGRGVIMRRVRIVSEPVSEYICSAAFELVWRRAIPHEEFKVDGDSGT